MSSAGEDHQWKEKYEKLLYETKDKLEKTYLESQRKAELNVQGKY
jgi:hypothetical protein